MHDLRILEVHLGQHLRRLVGIFCRLAISYSKDLLP